MARSALLCKRAREKKAAPARGTLGCSQTRGSASPRRCSAGTSGPAAAAAAEPKETKAYGVQEEPDADPVVRLKPFGKLHRLATDNRVPVDFMNQAYDIFIDFAEPTTPTLAGQDWNPIENGHLSQNAFGQVLCKISGITSFLDLPDSLLLNVFSDADSDHDRKLSFLEFATWFTSHGFSESVLLNQDQREVREIARKHNLNVPEVEEYRVHFQRFDEDDSGRIEFEEFQHLLYSLIKIPCHLSLPESRVKAFWTEALTEPGQNAIDFEEFLLFYKRYFGKDRGTRSRTSQGGERPQNTNRNVLEEFYRSLRPVSVPRTW